MLTFSKAGSGDPNRLNVVLNYAHRVRYSIYNGSFCYRDLYQLARTGLYQNALALLVHPGTWRGISLDEYQEWASMIWHILALMISRR